MTGTRAPLKIVPTHRTTSSGKTGSVLPTDTPAPPKPEIKAFLTHLAVQERISASSQNQALSAMPC